MYKLLIADDEFIELSSISQFISKELANDLIVETANNSMELLSVFESFKPDIILSDVEMPGMNGLTALRIIKRLDPRCKTIIYSAYDLFEYVRDALELKSNAYVLKPAKRKDLLKIIMDTIQTLQEEDERKLREEKSEHILEHIRPVIEADCLFSIMLSEIDSNKMKKHLALLDIPFSKGCIFTIRVDQKSNENVIPSINNRKELIAWLSEELRKIENILVGSYINEKLSCLLTLPTTVNGPQQLGWLLKLGENLIDQSYEKFKIKMNIGIGSFYDEITELSKSYHESIRILSENSTDDKIRYAGDILPSRVNTDPFKLKEQQLLTALESNNVKIIMTLLDEALLELNNSEMTLDQQRDSVLFFIITFRQRILNMNGDTQAQSSRLRYEIGEIQGLPDFRNLRKWLINQITELLESLETSSNQKRTSHSSEAIRYIETNFMKPISLELVADSIGVSSYYLSHLFTKEIGKSYIAYLTDLRIKKAQQILTTRTVSIKELANSVGYSNPTYFVKVFKKITDHTLEEKDHKCVKI